MQRERCDEDRKRDHDLHVRIVGHRPRKRNEEFAKHHDERLPRHDERTSFGGVTGDEEAKALPEAWDLKAPRRAASHGADAAARFVDDARRCGRAIHTGALAPPRRRVA